MFCFFGGGLGGNPETDGLNHGNNPISTATIPPLEILESLYPVMFTQWALRPDSGGPGRHRGGLGAIYEIEALADGGAGGVSARRARQSIRRPARTAAGTAALNRFVYETDARRSDAAARLQGHRRQDQPRPEGAAGNAGRRRLRRSARRAIRSASRATCGSATSRASAAARDYKVVLRATARSIPRPPRRRARMSSWRIVGVDVGGTFTDLFLLRSRQRARSRTAKVPSRRGDEAQGFLNGLRALGGVAGTVDRRTALPSAPTRCWSGAARRSASSRRAASATCWKCAAATAAAPGACGAISRRSPTATCGSK